MIKVAFVCVHNSCRSQIAEALGGLYGKEIIQCFSAGTNISNKINADAIRLVNDIYSIDMSKTQYPKTIDILPAIDVLITMGCNVECPYVPCTYREDWGLDDPTGKSDEDFIIIIKSIEVKVKELINRYSK